MVVALKAAVVMPLLVVCEKHWVESANSNNTTPAININFKLEGGERRGERGGGGEEQGSDVAEIVHWVESANSIVTIPPCM